MQVFERSLLRTHCVGEEWPDFIGEVAIGESFVIETEEADPNGPVFLRDIRAGDSIAVHVETIELLGPYFAPNGGPTIEGMGPPVPLQYRDGWFHWPEHFRLRSEPSVGNIAVLPAPTDSTFHQRPKKKCVDIVREAYCALREVVAARIGGTIEDANSIVATAADLRNCALYGLGVGYIPQDVGREPYDIAVVAALPKSVFASNAGG